MRVLVIDDSPFYRRLIARAAAASASVTDTDEAAGCDEALRKLATSPADIVFCDVVMPEKDGLQTLAEIQNAFPDTLVVMISGVNTRSTESTVRALQMGAFEFVRKPDSASGEENVERLSRDIASVLRLAGIHLNTHRAMQAVSSVRGEHRHPSAVKRARSHTGPYEVVVIGSSTGGPEALGRIIPALPGSFGLPILVVQHMPPPFTRALAQSLDRKSSLSVREAADGDAVQGGCVYVAPGAHHMTVSAGMAATRIRLNQDEPVHNCRPSVDVLFGSVAKAYGAQGVVAVVLTGMGEDGCDGVRRLKEGACCCVAQSEATCVVYGMPRAVSEAGLADLKLDIDQIAPVLTELAARASNTRSGSE